MDGEIEPVSLADLLATDEADPLVLDIRAQHAFRRGHIPGSLNLPMADLTGRIEAVDDADHVVTVCPHGEASIQAARLVSAYGGFDGTVESLAGGLEAWEGPLADGATDGSTDGVADTSADPSADIGDTDATDEPTAPF
ncbi:MAG: rhodanese-like domain-containing protein [Haloarculaceae archaeon]